MLADLRASGGDPVQSSPVSLPFPRFPPAEVTWRPSSAAGSTPPPPVGTELVYWGAGWGCSVNPARTWPEARYLPGPERGCNLVIALQGWSLQAQQTLKTIPPENQCGPQTNSVRGLFRKEPRRCSAKAPTARLGLEPGAEALATYVEGTRIPGGSDLPPPLSIILYISRRYTYKQVEILHPTAPFYT